MASTKIRGITIELNAETAGIMDGLKEINKSLGSTEKALKDVDKLLKFDPDNTTLLAQQQDYLAEAIEKTKNKLEEQKKLLESMKSADNASETVEQQKALEREIEATNATLNKYEDRLKQTDNALEEVKDETKEAKTETSTFAEVLKANLTSEVIISGLRKIAEGIKAIATNAMQVGSDFQSAMSQVSATMGLTVEEINKGSETYQKLSDAAKEMGKTTQYSATQASEALNYLALAGYDADKAVETLPKVLTLAAAGGMELAYASDLVTDSMGALGMSTDELDNYLDEMAKTSQKSNTSVSQLGEAILICGGVASGVHMPLENMNAALGVLANNGIKGAEGGTHLRNVILSLTAPTEKAEAVLKGLGLSIADSNGDMRDLEDILQDLNAALGEMGDVEKEATLKKIFNKTDIAAVNDLLKSMNGEYQDLKAELLDCAGAAESMAEVMLSNLQGNITILQSALEGLGISLFEVFGDEANDAVKEVTEAVGMLTDSITDGALGASLEQLSTEVGNLVVELINASTEALPGIIDGLTWFISNLPTIVDLTKGVAAGYVAYEVAVLAATIATEGFTVALAANPIGLMVGLVAGLTVGIVELAQEAAKASPEMQAFANKIDSVATSSKKLTDSTSSVMSELGNQRGYINALVSELQSYTTNGMVAADCMDRAKEIASQLNTAYDGLNMSIDEQTGYISTAVDDWEQYIEVMMKQAEVTAITEKLTDIARERLEVEEELFGVKNKLSDELLNNIEISEKYYKLEQEGIELTAEQTKEYEKASEYVNKLSADDEILYQSYIELTDQSEELNSKTDELNGYLKENCDLTSEDASNMDSLAEATDDAKTATDELGDSIDELSEDIAKEQEALEKLVESQVASFSKLEEAEAIHKDKLLENLQSNVDAMNNWAENMQILAERGIDDGILQELAKMGPEGAKQTQEFVNMTGEELTQASELWQEALSAEKFTDALAEEYMTAGTTITQAWIDGAWVPIEEEQPTEITNAMAEQMIGASAWDTLTEEAQNRILETMNGMSEAVEDADGDENAGTKMAEAVVEGATTTFTEKAGEVGESTKTGLTDPVKNTTNTELGIEGTTSTFGKDTGTSVISSMKLAVEDTTQAELLPAIKKMCDDTKQMVFDTWIGDGEGEGIRFQVWYDIGMAVDTSLAEGIKDGTSTVCAAIIEMCEEAVNSISLEGLATKIDGLLGQMVATKGKQ